MSRLAIVAAFLLVFLAGCTTIRTTHPGQTAREQLLLSTAADQASEQIHVNLPPNGKIYVDASQFTAPGAEYNKAYAINTITAALLRQGYSIARKVENADTVASISSGALSINKRETLYGIPSFPVPIPLAGKLNTPEFGFGKSLKRTGIAKFRLTFYNADTGRLQKALEPVYGIAHYDKSSILFYSWKRSNLLPRRAKKRANDD